MNQFMHNEEESSQSGIDLNDLMMRVEYDRELLHDMLLMFIEEFPQLHLQLKEALLHGDRKQVQIASHTLKGMLSSLSFFRAAASAIRIERMAVSSTFDGISEELDRLEREAIVARKSLEIICAEVQV